MTYEVKTPLALSCSYSISIDQNQKDRLSEESRGAEKKFWGFNAELITLWQEMLPQEAFARLKVFDHQCLEIGGYELQEGLRSILFQDLQKIEKEFDNTLVSAWLKIEPDRLLEIKPTIN